MVVYRNQVDIQFVCCHWSSIVGKYMIWKSPPQAPIFFWAFLLKQKKVVLPPPSFRLKIIEGEGKTTWLLRIHYLWFEKYVLKSFHFCCIKNYVLNPFFFSCQIIITNYFLKIDKIFGYSKPKTYSNYNTVFFSKENVLIKKLKIILAHLDLKDCWIFHPIQLIQKVS